MSLKDKKWKRFTFHVLEMKSLSDAGIKTIPLFFHVIELKKNLEWTSPLTMIVMCKLTICANSSLREGKGLTRVMIVFTRLKFPLIGRHLAHDCPVVTNLPPLQSAFNRLFFGHQSTISKPFYFHGFRLRCFAKALLILHRTARPYYIILYCIIIISTSTPW